ncbi:MAG: tetratricopeptide repeat protein [Candidatus Pelagibacter sp.]|tara:strand:- start:582 stop:1010 length:429 start_codon:yes stop_codon:yes gene_type:complete
MINLKKITYIIILIFYFTNQLLANTNYFNEGIKFYEKKEFKKAKFKFEQSLVLNPKNENSYLYLSKIFNFQEKKKLEEQNLKSVILINPKNEEAVYNLAKLKLKDSDYSGSKKLIEQLLVFCKSYCQKSKDLKIEIDNLQKK